MTDLPTAPSGPHGLAAAGSPGTLRALTGLRIFAAVHVFLFHFALPVVENLALRLSRVADGGPHWLDVSLTRIGYKSLAVVNAGYVSVSLFFILSGFILSYNYLADDGRRLRDRRSFWVARLARVYPVYVVAWVLMGAYFAWRQLGDGVTGLLTDAIGPGVAALFLLQAWHPRTALAWNGPGWSLSTEAFFYFCFPLLFAGSLGRIPARRRWMLATMAFLFALSLLAPVLYLMKFGRVWEVLPYQTTPGWWLSFVKFNPVLRLPEFALGVVLGKLYLHDQLRGRRAGPAWTIAGLALTFGFLAMRPALPGVLLHNGLLAPAFAMTIYGLAHGRWPARWISGPALVLLGEASYGLYILHLPVGVIFQRLSAQFGPAGFEAANPMSAFPLATLIYPFVLLAVTVAVAVATFEWVEKPVRRLIRRGLAPKVPPAGPAIETVAPADAASPVAPR